MDTLDVTDVAKVLRISVRTVRTRLATGRPMPPSFTVGRRRLFLRAEVYRWLRSQPGAVDKDESVKRSSRGLRVH
jgi:excisionase family DNA binding protein